MDIHEAAGLMPLDEENIPKLAEDIKANGLIDPIELFEGKVIDGRRRLQACESAGVEPRFKTITTADPVTYVLSKQNRRDLTPSQRSMIGARATTLREKLVEEAKDRQRLSGGDRKSPHAKSVPVTGPEPISDPMVGETRDQIGRLVGVSGSSIKRATRVIEKGIPELAKAVDEGRIAVSTAAFLAGEPEEVQRAGIENPKVTRREARKPQTEPEKPNPQWAEVATQLANVATLLVSVGATNEKVEEPWKLVESMENTAAMLLQAARLMRRRHHL